MKGKILNDLDNFFKLGHMSRQSVTFFIVQIRLLLEVTNSKNKFKLVNFYCNWFLHKNLNKSKVPEIVKRIANSFDTSNSKNELIFNLNQSISSRLFIIELKELLLENKITNSNIGDDEYMFNILEIILNEIKNRPLLLENKNIVIDAFEFSVFGIMLTNHNDKIVMEILSKELKKRNKRMLFDFVIDYL